MPDPAFRPPPGFFARALLVPKACFADRFDPGQSTPVGTLTGNGRGRRPRRNFVIRMLFVRSPPRPGLSGIRVIDRTRSCARLRGARRNSDGDRSGYEGHVGTSSSGCFLSGARGGLDFPDPGERSDPVLRPFARAPVGTPTRPRGPDDRPDFFGVARRNVPIFAGSVKAQSGVTREASWQT